MNLTDVIKATCLTSITFYMISATWRRRSQSYKVQVQGRSLSQIHLPYRSIWGCTMDFYKGIALFVSFFIYFSVCTQTVLIKKNINTVHKATVVMLLIQCTASQQIAIQCKLQFLPPPFSLWGMQSGSKTCLDKGRHVLWNQETADLQDHFSTA